MGGLSCALWDCGISGLFLLDASYILHVVTAKMSPDSAAYPWEEGTFSLVENQGLTLSHHIFPRRNASVAFRELQNESLLVDSYLLDLVPFQDDVSVCSAHDPALWNLALFPTH